MKPSRHVGFRTVVWIMAFVIASGFAGISRAECPDYPKVRWWGKLSHAKTIRLVNKKHKGDWEPYIEKWETQVIKLEDISMRGSAIVVTKDKIRLEGEDLAAYIAKVEQRIEVIQCLAEQEASK